MGSTEDYSFSDEIYDLVENIENKYIDEFKEIKKKVSQLGNELDTRIKSRESEIQREKIVTEKGRLIFLSINF